MKSSSLISVMLCALALITLTACGNGGGGGGGTSSGGGSSSNTEPTKAILTFSATDIGAIPANTIVTGYDLMFGLPAGVTVKSTTPPSTDTGVVTATGAGAGAMITGVYTPANSKVRILVISANGMLAGEFSTVSCDLAAGVTPDFSTLPQPTLSVSGYDTNMNATVDLTGQLSVQYTVKLQ